MKLFPVYNVFDIAIQKGRGLYVYDDTGREYLDCYGGHAVISIGHSHPKQVSAIKDQLDNLMFYSNSIINPLQEKLANKLAEVSGLANHQLFLVNSGAEANENALKLASFMTDRSRILAFHGSFHGRTSAAVNVTDNPKIKALINKGFDVDFIEFDDYQTLRSLFDQHHYAAVIMEMVQGVAGVYSPSHDFAQEVARLSKQNGSVFIADEVQSGTGRTGRFFAFQHFGIQPDIITTAKGLGNGFPIGAVLIHEKYHPFLGMLGTTFGGNHLACAAAHAVLEVIENEKLIENAKRIGMTFKEELQQLPQIQEVRGLGLMIGAQFDHKISDLRRHLLFKHGIFTGNAADPYTLRFLPPLSFGENHINRVIAALKESKS